MSELSEEELRGLFAQLSDRQLEVLRLLAGHQTAKEIARTLGISEHTIRAHTAKIRERLKTSNTREAAILLARYEGQAPIVNSWQPRSEGIALDQGLDAGSPDDPHPEPQRPIDDDDAPDGLEQTTPGESPPHPEAPAFRRNGLVTRGLIWLYARLQALSPIRWIALIGAATVVVLFITVGVISGAGALLQTLQEISVRAR